MTKQKLFISLIALTAIGGFSLMHRHKVFAEDNGQRSPLIQRIIDKYSLNETEVDKIVSDFREEQKVEHQKQLEDKLSELVTSGKLSEQQKTDLQAKLKEWAISKEDFKDLTHEEAHAKKVELHTEMKAWAKDHNIDFSLIKGFGKGGRGHKGF